jgi:penicillin-binding protein 1C
MNSIGKVKKRWKWIVLFLVFLYILWLPSTLFTDPTSTVLLDNQGHLLGAKIADDGQWRFEACDSVPHKFEKCILEFEDKNFYTHIGISAKGIFRAFKQNFQQGKIVSGGSTITMQLARLTRKNPPRTYFEKIVEMLFATRLEVGLSKKEILIEYSSHAPFGNNVVGLDAAAWRYYGRPAHKLSWAESATLAVLPNAPGLIYPGKNSDRLLQKRNRLLERLYKNGTINNMDLELALTEPLPSKPLPLPRLTPHLLDYILKSSNKGKTIQTSIEENIQLQAKSQLNQYMNLMFENQIHNGAIIITSVKTGKIIAYVGNLTSDDNILAYDVDCASAPRSSGSILKPILYLKSLEQGIITPNMLLFDVPSHFWGYTPKNFSGSYDGALPAHDALARSLNIPMVHLLQKYGTARFHRDLRTMGFTSLIFSPKHYGLSLILGGAETKLIDLAGVYTNLAQQLSGIPVLHTNYQNTLSSRRKNLVISKAAIYETFEAMLDVNRPDEDNNWRQFSSSRKIAWKTGTSFGFRDAWAVGITPDYVVSVWIGNANGEGRPGLTGIKAAAPLLFDVFNTLPKSQRWFKKPFRDYNSKKICLSSGYIASENCEKTTWTMLPKSMEIQPICPFHTLIHLNKHTCLRVTSECEAPYNMIHKKWFVLPSNVEHYYKLNHPNYETLPEFQQGCGSNTSDAPMTLLYPRKGTVIMLPKNLNEQTGDVVCELIHRNKKAVVYWHLDKEYIGQTTEIHQISIKPKKGNHFLKAIDENGNTVSVQFSIVR